jgi:Rrf2 family transcriptional regulator, iron-sulfur cluster assembly transcription factor
MILLSKRSMLGIAAVVDIAIHARSGPVVAKLLAARHYLPPRHLETLLQALVRNGILKGVRGPRGGYELGKERRRISAGDIVRAVMMDVQAEDGIPEPSSLLVETIIEPIVGKAGRSFLAELDTITVEELCRDAEALPKDGEAAEALPDFAI